MLAAAAGVIWLNTARKGERRQRSRRSASAIRGRAERVRRSESCCFRPQGELLRGLEELARSDARAEVILKQEELYTEDMLELPLKYPETLDFVLEYPEKKDRSPRPKRSEKCRRGKFPC